MEQPNKLAKVIRVLGRTGWYLFIYVLISISLLVLSELLKNRGLKSLSEFWHEIKKHSQVASNKFSSNEASNNLSDIKLNIFPLAPYLEIAS